MTWQDIIRKGMIKGHDDYKMYFSFFDGKTLPFGSVIEYTGSREIPIPVFPDRVSGSRQAKLENGTRYTIRGVIDPTYRSASRDYALVVDSDNGQVALPRRVMMEEGRNFKVISRGSEEQRNISVPRKK